MATSTRRSASSATDIYERSAGNISVFDSIDVPVFSLSDSGNPGGAQLANGQLVFALQDNDAYYLYVRTSASSDPDESCVAGADADGDGLADCADPDCWRSCGPACPYATSCP